MQAAARRVIRALVVDDSAFMRKMITELLAQDPEIEVVGQARDGADGLQKIEALQPDVVTLDVEMPVMDGLAVLNVVVEKWPQIAVVMVSSLTQAGAQTTIRCLELGAVDVIGKPGGSISLNIEQVAPEIRQKVKNAARARMRRPFVSTPPATPIALPTAAATPRFSGLVARANSATRPALLVIGSSTGGPRALMRLIPMLPADLNLPVVVVQHMPPGFTTSLAARLDTLSPLTVREASAGDRLTPNQVLIAPGGQHLLIAGDHHVRLSDEPPVHGVRPSVDVTLASVVGRSGHSMIAVLLTGMGQDGARGLKQVRDKGGVTIAEDESTCVVYGMPRAAVELGAVQELLPLDCIAEAIVRRASPKFS